MDLQTASSTAIATGNISPARFVKASGNYAIAQAGAGEASVGISIDNTYQFNSVYAGASGNDVGYFTEGQEAWLAAGGAFAAGDRLKSDANGMGVLASGSESSGAVALQGSTGSGGATGTLFRVRVETFIAPGTGATGATGPAGATGATGPGA